MRSRRSAKVVLAAVVAAITGLSAVPAGANGDPSMAVGRNGWEVEPIFTVGESIGDYTPPGLLDGLGAYDLGNGKVRVLANHELLHFRGYPYEVNGGIELTGARVSYFDIDKSTYEITDSGLAYDTVYDASGALATDAGFLANDLSGFSRFCSAALFEAGEFGNGRGLADRVYLTGEEDGGIFNSVGGAEWALDPETGSMWHLPDLGRGAWENVTVVDTGDPDTVAVMLADDTSPFDAGGPAGKEAAPLYLYVGEKDPSGDFPARNGLRGGDLYVFVPKPAKKDSPAEFNKRGTLAGNWVKVDNSPTGAPSEDGSTGYDEWGYPTQSTLWLEALDLGAFQFSRPEDIATNPANGREVVLASTGVDTFDSGVDTFGTIYKIQTNFENMSATLEIIFDGDADTTRSLRSPDNLDWADDGWIYIQEDEAEEDTLDGEPLFGPGAVNPAESSIVRMDKNGHHVTQIAEIDRSVILDASIAVATDAVDVDAGLAGEWETSGILDVSALFGHPAGTLFLFDVQAHGIEDQDGYNPTSRIHDGDLVEGGQLSLLHNKS